MQQNEIGPLHLTSYRKINSKWISNLNVRAKTIQLLGKNTDINLRVCELGSGFLAIIQSAQETKEK